nr:replication-associated protein [Cressdnaviricota sp.]
MSHLRLRATNYLLTYPHCNIQPETLITTLTAKLEEFGVVYMIACIEDHHESDAKHNHVFVRLRSAPGRADPGLFDIGDRHPNIQPARDFKASINYVKKDGNWVERGTNPVKEQALTTRERNAKILKDGIRACVADGTISIHNIQRTLVGIQALQMLAPNQRTAPTVYWFYGSTGSGKTRRALEICGEDAWISGENLKWFDGYTGQPSVVLDDLRTNSCSMNFLLRLLDRYRLFVPIKGGHADWRPTTIVITCPVPPRRLFVNRETGEEWDNVDQVIRRIHIMRDFDAEPYGSRPGDGKSLSLNGPATGAEGLEVFSAIERAPTPALPEVPMELVPEEPPPASELPSYALPVVEVPFTPVLDRWPQEEGPVKPVAVRASESN